MKRYIFTLILTLILAFDSFAQIKIDCNTEELHKNLQGVWMQTEGNALAIKDSNAYFLYGTDHEVWQDTHGELFSIIKNPLSCERGFFMTNIILYWEYYLSKSLGQGV